MTIGDKVQILANSSNRGRVGTVTRVSSGDDPILDVAFSSSVHDHQCYLASEVKAVQIDIEPYHFPHQSVR